jgi:ribosomal protein S18 acetylase RimI-like enzyme
MVSIKKATIDDAAAIAEIGRISFLESHGLSASAADIDSYISRKYTLNAVKEDLENPNNIFHIIYYKEHAAGYSKIILNTPHKDIPVQNITVLDRLYLLKEFYDRKLGLQLFDFNLNISKQANQTGIWLYTWIENKRAVSFYQRAGFKIVGAANFPISATHSNPNHLMYLEYGTL